MLGQNRPKPTKSAEPKYLFSIPKSNAVNKNVSFVLDIYNVPGRLFFLEICPSWTSLLRIGLLLILMYCPSRTFISGWILIRQARVGAQIHVKIQHHNYIVNSWLCKKYRIFVLQSFSTQKVKFLLRYNRISKTNGNVCMYIVHKIIQ